MSKAEGTLAADEHDRISNPILRPSVIGRERELALVEQFLRERSWPGILQLDGDAGIGKTTIWSAACAMAVEAGALLLVCRPAQAEVSLAFAGLVDLFESVPDALLRVLPEAQQAALATALRRRPPSRRLPDPLAVSAGVRAALANLALSRPVVVAIDDVQWIDPSTAAVLDYVLRRLTDESIGFLLAHRSASIPGTSLATDRIVPTRIAVEPLSLSSLHHVIRTRAGRVLARPVLRRVADASGGNPLLALGLVAALDQAPSPPGSGDPLPTPGTLIEVVAERVARLPAPSRDVLLIAASLASPTEALIARIAGGSVAGDIDAARAAGILDSLVTHPRFAHPLYAQAIRSLASPERRREVHGLIADLVAEPEEYARHRALAVPAPDDGVASALEAGASAALARGALRAAAELLDQARRFTPSAAASTGHERAFGAAELLILAGDRAAAGELLRDVVAHAASPVRERAMALYAEILVNQGALDEGERLFRSALGPDTPPSVAARIDLDLAYLSLVRLDTEEAARWADLGAVAARHGGEPALLAEALAYVALTRLLAGHEPDESQVADALALEDSSRPPYLGLSPRGVIGLVRALTARHEEARRLLGEARDALDQIGDDCDLAHALLWSAWNELRAGRLLEAAELAEQAATIAETTGSELLRAWACAVGALVAASRGDSPGVEAHVRAALGDTGASGIVVLWCAAATCIGHLAMDRPEAAASAMLALPETVLRASLADPVLGFFLPDVAEAFARAGMADAAGAILGPFEAAASSRNRRWARAAALRAQGSIHVRQGRLAEAIDSLRSAVGLHDPVELPLERARALLHLGQLLRRTGERRAAREALIASAEIFAEAGASGWARLATEEVRRVPGRRATSGDLTPAELRVAQLSGRGMTNREVATVLFVSPKTVEATLTRVYRKLAIATRAELGAWVAQHEKANAKS